MHTNHLGNYQQMLGSTLHFLVHNVMPGGDASENLRTVVGQCKAFWRRDPTPNKFQNIQLSMLRSSTGYPTLKGRASEIKHLVRALRDVWSIHREQNRDSDEYVLHAQIALLLQKFDEMDSVLDAHDPINYPCLPPGPQADFEKACWDAMSVMNFLGHFFTHVRPRPLFKITIKAHHLGHIALYSRFINPRLAICYSGEDYMRLIKGWTQSAIRGNNITRAAWKISEKVIYSMHVSWSREAWFR